MRTCQNVLVTGGCGFIGSAFIRRTLADEGFSGTLVNLDALTYAGSVLNLPGADKDPRYTFCEGRIQDRALVEERCREHSIDTVVHFAAESHVDRSIDGPAEFIDTNILGTFSLLEVVRKLGNIHFHHVSTDEVYGSLGETGLFHETTAYDPRSPYSASKAASELVAHSWRRSFYDRDDSLGPIATARAGNVIGGGDYAEDRIVPDAVRALMASKAVPVRNPAAVRPWQHVIDCLSGYLWLGARMGGLDVGSTYNFGPNPESQQPVQQLVEELLKHWPGDWCNLAEDNPPPEAPRLSLSIDKAERELGWQPVWDWQTAVERTAAWYHARHVDNKTDLREYSLSQIIQHCDNAATAGRAWAR